MEKIIGRVYTFLLLFCFFNITFCGDIKVSLNALDKTSKERIDIVGVGVPFYIDAIVENATDSMAMPSIDGLSNIEVLSSGSSTSISSINGVTTRKRVLNNLVRINKPGEVVVGPAVVDIGGDVYRSEPLKINVSTESKEQIERKQGVNLETTIEISVDKSRVVVGEQINFSIKVYRKSKDVSIENFTPPDLSKFSMTDIQGPITRKEKFGDGIRNCLEWRCLLFAKESGDIVIPAITLNYNERNNERRHRSIWDLMDIGGSGTILRRQTYSNSISLAAKDLPESKFETNAVGKFRSFIAKVDRKKAREGEAVELSLILEGNGNFEMISPPQLELPSPFKHYESSQKIETVASKQAARRKIFSYIVQGVKYGNWEIPSQKITYFDVHTHRYRTVRTDPIMLKIEQLKTVKNDILQKVDDSKNDSEILDKKLEINTYGPWGVRPVRMISWMLFFMLSLGVLFLMFIRFFVRLFFAQKTSSTQIKRKAFKDAYKLLKIKEKNGDVGGVYGLFNSAIAKRLMVEKASVTESLIVAALRSGGADKETLEQWGDFYTCIAENKFFSKKIMTVEKNKLFKLAKIWLEKLENYL